MHDGASARLIKFLPKHFYSSSFSPYPQGLQGFKRWTLRNRNAWISWNISVPFHNWSLARAFLFYSFSVFWTHWQTGKTCDVGGKFSPSTKLFLGRNRNKSLVRQSGRALCLLFGASKRVNIMTMFFRYVNFHVILLSRIGYIIGFHFCLSFWLLEKRISNNPTWD